MAKRKKRKKNRFFRSMIGTLVVVCLLLAISCFAYLKFYSSKVSTASSGKTMAASKSDTEKTSSDTASEKITTEEAADTREALPEEEDISWDPSWEYADFSEIHDSDVHLYRSQSANRRDIVVAVNAGHGTEGGESVYTYCHPDKSTKVTGGTNAEGSEKAMAVSSGMDFNDGYPEAKATLSLAVLVKDQLLEAGFDVLMIRESDDVQLDNVARTVFANNNADYHIALHYDGTEEDKGAYFISVPDEGGYRDMEPVASHWQEHMSLGEALIDGLSEEDVKIWSDGELPLDLTQTSFSTIASVDLEVGDGGSDYSEDTQSAIARGIVDGMISLVKP